MQADATFSAEPSATGAEHARLLTTLVGALIGAAIGVGLHLVLETGIAGTQPYEAIWFALIIGLCTGFGVRMANKGHMGRSYARGAVSGVVALAAIVISTFLISQVMAKRDIAKQGKPIAAAAQAEQNEAPEGDAGVEAAPAAMEEAPVQLIGATGVIGRPGADKLNPWQFVFMAAGALIAYELGRGVEHRQRVETFGQAPAAAPVATDPSN